MADTNRPPDATQVLIAGGGPAGLSASIELGYHGVDNVVVEPRTNVSHTNPRAKLTNVRTMEHLRRWGIADRLRERAHLPVEWSQDVVFCRRLLGDEIARFTEVFGSLPDAPERYAERPQQIPQYLVEEVLRETVRELDPCSLVTGWRVDDVDQEDDVVEATVENTVERLGAGAGERRVVTADYLLGCDGAHSTVREEIGSAYEGDVRSRTNLGMVIRAPDLADRHTHGPAVHYWTINETVQGFMGRLDRSEKWWVIVVDVDDPDDADPAALVSEMIGGEAPIDVLGTDPWSPRMLLVDHARVGRVFLVGDAAHLNPPWGGHGFNTGVGDAVDVGWKLAAVLNGWGGPGLLDAYERERRSVQEEVVRVSSENMDSSPADLAALLPPAGRADDGDDPYAETARRIYEAKKLEFHSLGLVLGYRYDDSPIVADEGDDPPPSSATEYTPTTYPGSRLPHVWLDATGETSIFDVLGPEFTLLRLDPSIDVSPFEAAADALDVPLETVDVDATSHSPTDDATTHPPRYERPLLLVRPDQHVAWRGSSVPEQPRAVIERVCGH